VNGRFGVLTAGGTPLEIVQRLNAEMVRILTAPDIKERFGKMAVAVVAGTPEQFSEFLKKEVHRWAKLILEAGIRPD
jgi:tripartite-type tricarboxylate transporter receptor subunit TctC